jgi:hypothetical protein
MRKGLVLVCTGVVEVERSKELELVCMGLEHSLEEEVEHSKVVELVCMVEVVEERSMVLGLVYKAEHTMERMMVVVEEVVVVLHIRMELRERSENSVKKCKCQLIIFAMS